MKSLFAIIALMIIAMIGTITAIRLTQPRTITKALTTVTDQVTATTTHENTVTTPAQTVTVNVTKTTTTIQKPKPVNHGVHRSYYGKIVFNAKAGGIEINGAHGDTGASIEHVPFHGRTLWCIYDINGDTHTWTCDWYGYHHTKKGQYIR